MPDMGERPRVEEIDLEPEQVERIEGLRDAYAALRLKVEVEIDDRPRAVAGSFTKRLQQPDERVCNLLRSKCAVPCIEPRHEHLRVVAGNDDVRLEGAVAVLDDLATQRRDFRPYLEVGGLDVASVDVIWNGFHQAKKIADLAETFEVNCAPHNYYSNLATFIAAQWCAAIPNARILEYDVDDVPWRDELVDAQPEISAGELRIPDGPGWGVELNEDVLRAHPWPRG